MNLKSRLKPFTALAFTALTVSSLGAGCSDLKDVQDAACCKGFEAGKVMTAADFDVDASIEGSFVAFANAAGDLSAVATGSIGDVTIACQNIALDLGADPADPKVQGVIGTAALTAWCDLAKGQISANFGASGTLATSIAAKFVPPKCTASLSATANCQASCDVSGSCDIKATPPKCEGGKLSVECSGGCTADVGVDVSCTGSCDLTCSGACQATAGATVDCKGKCDGKCELAADAKLSCKGTCDGSCSGKCSGTATVKAKCDGKCDADYTPLKCEGGTLSGGCMVDADCQGSCNASASAKAECTPPSVSIVATAKAGLKADAQLQLQAAIASLEVNLPNILVVLQARGEAFTGSLTAAAKAGASITGSGKLNASGAVCGVLIASTIGTASSNFAASLSAAGSVAGSVKLN